MTLIKWRSFWAERLPLHLVIGKAFQVPVNVNIWYVFGALLVLALALQLLTGLWLTLFYLPSADTAFASIQHLMRQVPYGWLLRSLHTTGASAIFVLMYLHIFRGLLYRSYQQPRQVVWLIGVVLFWLMLAEAFSGYLLPWGQMSYWGATVVTNMLTALPAGETLVAWLRGDFVVSGVTLQRFFSLHIIAIPLLMFWLIRLHINALHHVGSGHPKSPLPVAYQPFYPRQFQRECVAWLWYLLIFCAIVFFLPRGFGLLIDSANEQVANPWQTPQDIRPLWFMAPYYALLRSIPNKTAGLLTVAGSLLFLAALPWWQQACQILPTRWRQYRRSGLAVAVLCFIGLTVIGLINMSTISADLCLGFAIIGIVALSMAL